MTVNSQMLQIGLSHLWVITNGTFLLIENLIKKGSRHSAPERNKATSTMAGKSMLHFHESQPPTENSCTLCYF
ncbi:tRNA uridine 5-carboxymethylaminomethyl modification enzyme MnmG [Trichinella pseudospiralis]